MDRAHVAKLQELEEVKSSVNVEAVLAKDERPLAHQADQSQRSRMTDSGERIGSLNPSVEVIESLNQSVHTQISSMQSSVPNRTNFVNEQNSAYYDPDESRCSLDETCNLDVTVMKADCVSDDKNGQCNTKVTKSSDLASENQEEKLQLVNDDSAPGSVQSMIRRSTLSPQSSIQMEFVANTNLALPDRTTNDSSQECSVEKVSDSAPDSHLTINKYVIVRTNSNAGFNLAGRASHGTTRSSLSTTRL